MPTILFDGRDAYRKGGTGIATYARTLGSVARRLGFETREVASSDQLLSRRDHVLNEIRFHEAPRRMTYRQLVDLGWRSAIGGIAALRPTLIQPTGVVVDPKPERKESFDSTYAAHKLFLYADIVYRIHRRRAVMRFDRAPEVFHATTPMPLKVRGAANIYTIHDIIPIRLPYASLTDKRSFYSLVRDLCRKADHIVTVSEFSRRDIIALTGISENRITNTYQSVSLPADLVARGDDDVAADLERIFGLESGEYFLFLGAIEPKKNVARLIDAFKASGCRRQLVLAGGLGWQYEGELKRIEEERYRVYRQRGDRITAHPTVRQIDHLPLDQLISLIRGARAVVFPSLYEGFGLPVLEAMLLGTPVITSNAASLPEVAGEAALLVDPTDVSAIAAAIRTLDQDADLRGALSARGRVQAAKFSVAAYEEKVAAVYRPYAGAGARLPPAMAAIPG